MSTSITQDSDGVTIYEDEPSMLLLLLLTITTNFQNVASSMTMKHTT
ncbi:8169_t:CDS:2 [Racocetra fulgida]|uniref:8169_t:CDS:1 n=1 Tax=Racocetra fulgida TaxID=60492 RepID=A0A9N8WJR2_9GLOM|nr:8169_t:CDS:2 [Racocetra fulgida]